MPLMTKEESDLGLPSSPKGKIVGTMTQVLSLMETHSDDRSQFNRLTAQSSNQTSQNVERKVYAGSPLAKPRIHAGSLYTSRVYVHTHFHRMKGVYILDN